MIGKNYGNSADKPPVNWCLFSRTSST